MFISGEDAERESRIIVETDSTTIVSRVSRPRADPTDLNSMINGQALKNAYQSVVQRIQQLWDDL